MKKMVFLTTDKIVQIYRENKEGKSMIFTAREMGLPHSTVASCLKKIEDFMLGRKTPQHSSYKNALGIITQSIETKSEEYPKVEEVKPIVTDSFEKLENGFKAFQNVIGTFIDEMMDKRFEHMMAENKDLKDKLEKLQNASFVGVLKQKYG
jgi:hypothetical protein